VNLVQAIHTPWCIISRHLVTMNKWNIAVPDDMETVYWLPKFLYSSRFIAVSNRCTTKPLSGLLTICLTTILTHFTEYCNGIYRNTGVNGFLIHYNQTNAARSLDT
jgi:hypothetical protein